MALKQYKPTPLPDFPLAVQPPYQVRFINPAHIGELVNLYHLARVAHANDAEKRGSRYHRKLWAAEQFHKAHPEVTETAAYKDLEGLLS